MTVDIVFGWSIFDIAIDGNGNGSGCGGSASRVFCWPQWRRCITLECCTNGSIVFVTCFFSFYRDFLKISISVRVVCIVRARICRAQMHIHIFREKGNILEINLIIGRKK